MTSGSGSPGDRPGQMIDTCMYYVYLHINPLTKEVFYVGKGKGKRAFASSRRNSSWRQYVGNLQDHFEVSIVHFCKTEAEALEKERLEIQKLVLQGKPPIVDGPIGSFSSSISIFVRTQRKKAKLTQAELADRAGVGLRLIREIEGGKKSTLRMDGVNQVLHLFGSELGPAKKSQG